MRFVHGEQRHADALERCPEAFVIEALGRDVEHAQLTGAERSGDGGDFAGVACRIEPLSPDAALANDRFAPS